MLRRLPPFGDVKPALEQLHAQGFRLAALTNSGAPAAKEMLKNAQVAELFEQIISADSVKRLKPAAEPYQMAARELGVEIGFMMMVAAHSWESPGPRRPGAKPRLFSDDKRSWMISPRRRQSSPGTSMI